MPLADLFQEFDLGIAHIGQGLAGYGVGKKDQKINRMAGIQGHTDLGILLRTPDAGAVTGPRIEDDNGAAGGLRGIRGDAGSVLSVRGLAPLIRNRFAPPVGNAHHCIVDGAF